MDQPTIVSELWREQSLWSRTANRMKKNIEAARLQALLLVVGIALFATAATVISKQLDVPSKILAALAAVGSAVLPMLRPRWSGAALRDWTRARSVSEALKADVYQWLAKIGPFAQDAGTATLRDRADKLALDTADLLVKRDGIEPEARGLPLVDDLTSYFTVRVQGQYEKYYDRKARAYTRKIRQFRRVEIGLGILGALIGGAAAIFGASFAAWISVVATVGTALSVHVAATRYEFQLIEFLRTAKELRQIKSRADEPGLPDDERRRLAMRAERVISIETQGWMAKLAENPVEQKSPEHAATDSEAE